MSLNIGFFGSAPFVADFLDAIYRSQHRIAFVVTAPDKPRGRGRVVTPPEAKQFAIEKNIPCLQPDNIKDNAVVEQLKGFNADLFLVIAYGKKLNPDLLYLPPYHSFNLHFSLLPRWRGAAPVNWAVISGDRETGLTFMKMDEGLDTGDVVFQERIDIHNNETSEELFRKLVSKGKNFLIESLTKLENKNYSLTKQDDLKATYAPTFKKDDGLIDWNDKALVIHNKIRGLQPWPAAFTFFKGKRLKLLRSMIVNAKDMPGRIVKTEKDGFIVTASEEALKILEVQEEGKSRMSAGDFIRGKGDIMGSFFDNYGKI